MRIKELVKLLESLNNPEAIVDMASDEEGNAFSDIFEATTITPRKLLNGEISYTLYPITQEQEEERYHQSDVYCHKCKKFTEVDNNYLCKECNKPIYE